MYGLGSWLTSGLRLIPDGVSDDGLQLLRLILDALVMKELSVAEQRYKAVLAVVSDGRQVSEAAAAWGVSRQTPARVAVPVGA